MGNFRNERGQSRFGDRPRGGGFGGRGSFGRDRNDRFSRGPSQMFDATCSKCGKSCQVPFRPTGSKPVFCSDCFRQNNETGSEFGPRTHNRPRTHNTPRPSNGSSDMDQINAKLDRILRVLEDLEIDTGEDLEGEEEPTHEPSEESEDDSEEELQ